MRVSKLSCLNGPEPEPTKLLTQPVLDGMSQGNCASGSTAKTFIAAGEAMLTTGPPGPEGSAAAAAAVNGIQFGSVVQPAGPQNRVRLAPELSPVSGSKITPPPDTKFVPVNALSYSLRSQYPAFAPVVLVGVHVDR